MEETKDIEFVKGTLEDKRSNTYEYEVLYNNKTHAIEQVISLVMNTSVKISMNQEMQKRILSELKKQGFSKEKL